MKPINPSRLKKILVTRIDRIGDVVLSTPVFKALKEKYQSSFLAVMVSKQTEPVVKGNPWVDAVIVYDKQGKERGWYETLHFGLRLRKEHFDVAIHLHPTNRVNVITWLAQIPIRIGYRSKNHYLLTHVIHDEKWRGEKHEAAYNFDLLAPVSVPRPKDFGTYFPLYEPAQSSLKQVLPGVVHDRYVVFHPSASCISKCWSPENFAGVADRMVRQYGIFPVIIGEGAGVQHAGQMESCMKEKAFNASGRLNLETLGWLLKGARLLISNDSGPVHIASALGTPVISIFGRNQPGLSTTRWKPLSRNSSYLQKEVGCTICLAHNCVIDFKCLKELKPEEVLEEVNRYGSSLA